MSYARSSHVLLQADTVANTWGFSHVGKRGDYTGTALHGLPPSKAPGAPKDDTIALNVGTAEIGKVTYTTYLGLPSQL